MKFYAWILIFLLIISFSCEKWNYEKRPDHDFVTFEKTFDVNGNEQVYGIIPTLDNGFAIIGTVKLSIGGESAAFLIKTDSIGNGDWISSNQQWNFSTHTNETGRDIIQTQNGEYVILGTRIKDDLTKQLYIINIQQNGNFNWENEFGFEQNEEGYSILSKEDNGFLLFGYSSSFNDRGNEAIIYVADAQGEYVTYYRRNISSPYDDQGLCIIPTSNNNYVLLINTCQDETNSCLNLLTILQNDLSAPHIDSIAFGNYSNVLPSIIQNTEGRFAIAGGFKSDEETILNLIITNNKGQNIITKSFPDIYPTKGVSIIQTVSGEYAILNSDGTLIKTTGEGAEIWRQLYDITTHGNNCILETSDGGFVLAGITNTGSSDFDVKLIKTDSNGNIR